MFRGASAINLDAKGRMAMPSRYREKLRVLCDSHLVITIDLVQPCLLLFPLPNWEELEKNLEKLSNTNPTHGRIKRLLLGHASDVDMDNNGRLLIPSVLREHAGLKKQIMLAGQGKTFQIWEETRWTEQIKLDIQTHANHVEAEAELPELSF